MNVFAEKIAAQMRKRYGMPMTAERVAATLKRYCPRSFT